MNQAVMMQAVRQFLPGCSMADITHGLAANNGCLLEYAETVNTSGNQDGATSGPDSIIVHKIVHFHPWAVVVLLEPHLERIAPSDVIVDFWELFVLCTASTTIGKLEDSLTARSEGLYTYQIFPGNDRSCRSWPVRETASQVGTKIIVLPYSRSKV